jgi:putative tryptophan/tyrosine transport system substrate-binding protein
MAINIGRRQFISVIGGAAVAWPLAASGQQPAQPVIGFLSDATPETFARSLMGFRRGLSEVGFNEDRNLTIEYRWARGHYDMVPDLATDLVRRQVAVIVTSGSENVTRAAMAATTAIPIVAMLAGDPVKRGLVASVNRPGGNVTVAHQLVPKAAIVGWFVDSNIRDYDDELSDLQHATQALGLELKVAPVAGEGDLERASELLAGQGAGIILETGPVFSSHRAQVITLAASKSLPMIYEWRDFVSDGGLMSYGTDRARVTRQAGIYAGRILKGEKVSDMPVVQPDKYELLINLKTAKTLGLTIPDKLLALADEVIE